MITGFVYMLPFYTTSSHSVLDHLPLPDWAAATIYVASLVIVFVLLSTRCSGRRIILIPLFLVGSAWGITLDCWIDFNFFGVDRNLFPLEIAVSWVWLTPFVGLGTGVGWWLNRNRAAVK